MSNIAKIDQNFEVQREVKRPDMCFYDPEQAPFSLHGIFREGDCFVRLPRSVAEATSEGVVGLYQHTAGGRIRFCTDSPYVALHSEVHAVCYMSHMTLTGTAGFDLYDGTRFCGAFVPPYGVKGAYDSIITFEEGRKKRVVTINFPLYGGVKRTLVGLADNSVIEPAPAYTIAKPIVYYGSSITQGGCASRPGNSYQEILSRRFDCDYINLGFSGNAKGEKAMSEYIASLPMSVFVYDYDHNAPSCEHLMQTHERMFLELREKQPETPVIMMTRPKWTLNDEELRRMEIIRKTYENAKARGDRNVYFIDGRELMDVLHDDGTVDRAHPTDAGFWNMAKRLGDEMERHYEAIFGRKN